MRYLWLAVLGVVAAGCDFGAKPCSKQDTSCPAGSTCDVTLGYCVVEGATGGGGGSTTGGGGGSTTGGGGGSTTGGGGGTVGECANGCEAWQTCQPGNGGTCRDVTVSIVSPADMTPFSGAAAVRVTASVVQWDGGAFIASSIPASAESGRADAPDAGLLRVDGGIYEGVYRLRNLAGPTQLTAGWPATSASVTVLNLACDKTCNGWEQCIATRDGGVCQDLGLSMSWTLPTVNQPFGGGYDASVVVAFTTADGGAFAGDVPASVSDDGSAGLVQLAGSVWRGVLNVGVNGGAKKVTVGWPDGGPSWERNIFVDVVGPQLGLVVDAGTFQRDAIAMAVVTSNEAIGDAGIELTLGGMNMPQRPLADCQALNAANAAACFELDFSKPTLNALNGNLPVAIAGQDLYGNRTNGADGGLLPVSRIRWDVAATSFRVQSLGVDSSGNIFVGTSTNGGELVRLAPNGSAIPAVAIGEVQSIAVGPPDAGGLVYLAYNTTVGQVGAVNPGTLASVGSPCTTITQGTRTYSGLALYTAMGQVLAIGSINSEPISGLGSKGCLYDPTNGPSNFGTGTQAFDMNEVGTTGAVTVAQNVVIANGVASFVHKTGSGASWQPASLNGLNAPSVGTPVQFGSDAASTATGAAVLDGGAVIAGAGATSRQFFVFGSTGLVTNGSLGSDTDKGVPVFASTTEGYSGQGDGLVRFNPSSLGTGSAAVSTVTSDSIRTSPVLGAPRGAGLGTGYAVSRNGRLIAFSHGGTTSTELWRFSLGDSVVAHPAFDCNRSAPNSGTGILYVGTVGGSVKAIVVDSPKLLDSPGAWPKYQRSMGNAGNDDLANFPTNWDACR